MKDKQGLKLEWKLTGFRLENRYGVSFMAFENIMFETKESGGYVEKRYPNSSIVKPNQEVKHAIKDFALTALLCRPNDERPVFYAIGENYRQINELNRNQIVGLFQVNSNSSV